MYLHYFLVWRQAGRPTLLTGSNGRAAHKAISLCRHISALKLRYTYPLPPADAFSWIATAACILRITQLSFPCSSFSFCRLLHRFDVFQCQRLTESNFVTLISSFPAIALFLNYSANLKILIKFIHLYAFNFLFNCSNSFIISRTFTLSSIPLWVIKSTVNLRASNVCLGRWLYYVPIKIS